MGKVFCCIRNAAFLMLHLILSFACSLGGAAEPQFEVGRIYKVDTELPFVTLFTKASAYEDKQAAKDAEGLQAMVEEGSLGLLKRGCQFRVVTINRFVDASRSSYAELTIVKAGEMLVSEKIKGTIKPGATVYLPIANSYYFKQNGNYSPVEGWKAESPEGESKKSKQKKKK